MKGEHSNKCDICKSFGSKTHSRVFYSKINGVWKWICKECWNIQENGIDFKVDLLKDLKYLKASIISAGGKNETVLKDLLNITNRIIKKVK